MVVRAAERRRNRPSSKARTLRQLRGQRVRELLERRHRPVGELRATEAGEELPAQRQGKHLAPAQGDREPPPISVNYTPPRAPAFPVLVDGDADPLEDREIPIDGARRIAELARDVGDRQFLPVLEQRHQLELSRERIPPCHEATLHRGSDIPPTGICARPWLSHPSATFVRKEKPMEIICTPARARLP